jgi:hypothetical protein
VLRKDERRIIQIIPSKAPTDCPPGHFFAQKQDDRWHIKREKQRFLYGKTENSNF